MTANISLSTKNIDYSGYEFLTDRVTIKDQRLLDIFIRRIMRVHERDDLNPMMQSTAPFMHSDSESSAGEIVNLSDMDSIEDLDELNDDQ